LRYSDTEGFVETEGAFVAAIRANPGVETLRLVYADWLDERGDPRGEFLRTHRSALIRDERLFVRTDRPVFCPLLETELSVSVFTDGAEVQQDQVAALARFLAIPPGHRATLLEPLFENYRAMFDAVGEGPEIAGPEQVWAFVQWTDLIVPRQGTSGNRFVFVQGTPAWEEEHGVEMLFRDEWLLRLNQASGAFLSNCFWDWT
jgi:uncharacterized protein (TIGR02996 family)